MNTGKAKDPFGLLTEHLIYTDNPTFIQWLADFYTKTISGECIPNDLCISTIVPIVKSYTKSLNSANNYRGISITPTLTKLLECIISN